VHKYSPQAILHPKFVFEVLTHRPAASLAYFVSHTVEWLEPAATLLRVSDRYAAYLWAHLTVHLDRTAAQQVIEDELHELLQHHRRAVAVFLPFLAHVQADASSFFAAAEAEASSASEWPDAAFDSASMPQVSSEMPQVSSEMPQVSSEMPQVSSEMPQVSSEMHEKTDTTRHPLETPQDFSSSQPRARRRRGAGRRLLQAEEFLMQSSNNATASLVNSSLVYPDLTWKSQLLQVSQTALSAADGGSGNSVTSRFALAAHWALTQQAAAASAAPLWNTPEERWYALSPGLPWPPRFGEAATAQGSPTAASTCPTGAVLRDTLVEALNMLQNASWTSTPSQHRFPTQRLGNATKSVLKFHRYEGPLDTVLGDSIRTDDSFVHTVLVAARDALRWALDIDVRTLIGFLTGTPDDQDTHGTLTLAGQILGAFQCNNYADVILQCNDKRADTFVGALAVVVLLGSLYFAFGSIAAFALAGVFVPTFILWFVYSYSPGCIPYIPACLADDVVSIATWLLPLQVVWPAALERTSGCALNASIPASQCFRPCSDIGYTSWQPIVAWAACDWDPDWCASSFASWAASARLSGLRESLLQKQDIIVSAVLVNAGEGAAAAGRIEAERFCFAVTSVFIVPYILVLIGLLYALTAAAAIPLVVLQAFTEVCLQTLAYVHAHTPGRLPRRGRGRG
jgi:hypothetical protein